MICFRCGEKNPDSYRFCGMCGGPLQAAKTAGGADPVHTEPSPEQSGAPATESRTENFPFSRAERISKPVPTENVAPIGGPSLLGLNEPSMDSLREKAFSSAEETYFEPEAGTPAWKRIFMTLVVLGALGGAAWWAYTNYAQPGASAPQDSGPKQDTATNSPAATVPQKKEPAPPAVPASAPTESSATADAKKTGEQSQANDSTASDTRKTDEQANANDSAPPEQAKTEPVKPVEKPHAETPQAETPQPKSQEKNVAPAVKPATSVIARKPIPAPEKAVKAPPAAIPAEGDALFRRGEAYLYGRGVAENCDQAIKYLKSASDKSNAKARSAFGTMYATGHCVSRDLPTSYHWFALALRIDPNNQILEKDLSAVWNQMTPPERQLATKPSSQ